MAQALDPEAELGRPLYIRGGLRSTGAHCCRNEGKRDLPAALSNLNVLVVGRVALSVDRMSHRRNSLEAVIAVALLIEVQYRMWRSRGGRG